MCFCVSENARLQTCIGFILFGEGLLSILLILLICTGLREPVVSSEVWMLLILYMF